MSGVGKAPEVTGKPALKGYLYVLGSILLVTLAQLGMKWGVIQLPAWQADLAVMLAHPLPLLVILAGVGCYALSLLCWLAALHSTPLNIAYPLLSTSYALVYLLAVSIPSFAESLEPGKAVGVIFILLGAVLVGIKPASKQGAS
ncbi:4-amino-4-deoxy-L-arabinose-phosphoundecaprenol flippase subunit ArnF [Aeromonas sp. MR19]|uniref:Probable 4-amino-4-deoxy-L-arabinose-phosphoundecaprenol flippase subunit ArnF n=1 Tax=Aeromonas bestiarum TaxID=105751 RepID=A0AAP4J824_9GAMM|nr:MULTISPECIES: 4-amino-4-deoxy-L-arabinose-phosphoundecaprenol flippase subunit ArnF [Aeromonas]MCH7376631.1 4-amino-4-deoxy-L-arabinose-phosphoundecaprenol flippase subunit ArnF [Aeromonas sp. MR19]MDM5087416.1 4-amino-4-deoxy-L-arabinose-phosphoundecaprenol flippase subunit ArnF [Aeromonas bestiarum]MDM5141170.1 4-amino-4-deoxy-L-arabinose-phosphoundecaprenol flippase subunit ArnF [Aeromonas bestiarum]WDL81726.1 4-amino-4-deoxy-L-arabinose-phospho-UDP flippase [Aeromonas bestiarum]